jgi:thiamine kinase-like enzyme
LKINDFLTNTNYLYLPTKNNPKVIINVSNKIASINSFKLYNPFSTKVKYFKNIVSFLFIHFNFVFKYFASTNSAKSQFIKYLEEKLNTHINSSIYIATAKDKVVVQLQEKSTNHIIGYVKYPINDIGIIHIENEIKADSVFDNSILIDKYENIPFIILKELKGNIEIQDDEEILKLLNTLKTNKRYKLSEHPRILEINHYFETYKLDEFSIQFKNLTKLDLDFGVVYEHGDFAPWNIVKTENDELKLFDFEYFVKEGLEYMDLIKYYFQIESLLNQKKDRDLLDSILSKLEFENKNLLLKIYLYKEIMIKHSENINYQNEINLLDLMEKL